MNIERANEKMIESELYSYKDTLKFMNDLEDEIINASASSSEVHTKGAISDVTGDKAIRLTNNMVLMECRRRIQAIDSAMEIIRNSSEPKKYEMIRMKYFDKKYTDYGIMKELPVSRRTFYRWRKDAIILIARKLGCRVNGCDKDE